MVGIDFQQSLRQVVGKLVILSQECELRLQIHSLPACGGNFLEFLELLGRIIEPVLLHQHRDDCRMPRQEVRLNFYRFAICCEGILCPSTTVQDVSFQFPGLGVGSVLGEDGVYGLKCATEVPLRCLLASPYEERWGIAWIAPERSGQRRLCEFRFSKSIVRQGQCCLQISVCCRWAELFLSKFLSQYLFFSQR